MNKQGPSGYSSIWPESVSQFELMRDAIFDLPSSAPWATNPYWLRSSTPLRGNGGILGSLARPSDPLSPKPEGWPQSPRTPIENAGILASLARSMEPAGNVLRLQQLPNAGAFTPVVPTMLPSLAQASGDIQNGQTPSDTNAQVTVESAKPIMNPPSQNLEDESVRSPASRDADEPNRSLPSAATHPAPPAPSKDFRTRLLEALSDKNLRYYAGPKFSEFIDKFAALAPLLPGSGTVQSMQDGRKRS